MKIISNLSQVFIANISLFFCGHLGPDEFDGVSLAYSVNIKIVFYFSLKLRAY
jgi:hypothetical protein